MWRTSISRNGVGAAGAPTTEASAGATVAGTEGCAAALISASSPRPSRRGLSAMSARESKRVSAQRGGRGRRRHRARLKASELVGRRESLSQCLWLWLWLWLQGRCVRLRRCWNRCRVSGNQLFGHAHVRLGADGRDVVQNYWFAEAWCLRQANIARDDRFEDLV